MRRLLPTILLALTVAAVSVAAAGAASPESLRLTQLQGTEFPKRAYVLTLSVRKALQPENVHVAENGEPVAHLEVVPATAAGSRSVILAVDASNSMRGKPIQGAVKAARALVSQRNVNQQVGMVTFNDDVAVALSPTADAETIDNALAASPPLAQGTSIYDGVMKAVQEVAANGGSSGSVVLLSDGADTASEATLEQVAARAKAAHVKVFAVGLRSRAFKRAALSKLATTTGGRYYEAATPEQLAPIYDQLGYELANEYVIRYGSRLGPEQRVHVVVTVDGVKGAARTGYVSPALPSLTPPPYHKSLQDKFWESGMSVLIVSLLAAAILALSVIILIRPRNRALRSRMAEFVSIASEQEGSVSGQRLTERVFTGTEKSLERLGWWSRFKEELEIAQIRMPAVQIVLWTVVATFLVGWILFLIAGPLLALFALVVPFASRHLVKRKLEKRRAEFLEQLPDNIQVLASALRAGHSLVGALSVVVDDSPEPSKSELRRVIADEQLGIPLEDALMNVAKRMDCSDLEQVALVAALGRETGGNTAEVLDRVNDSIRERFELRRLVRTLTAQGRMSRWVVSFLPLVLVGAILIINPGYLKPLAEEPLGRALIALSILMVIAGSLVIRRIVNIKV
jgi:tight adherence protein B